MRSAKSGGGAGYAFFEQRMTNGARDQLDLLRDLRRALADGQLHLVYQPKIHAPSGEITGAEALMRWEHPTRGLVGPDQFIPIAERFGLISAMGNWLIEEACRQAGVWRDQGLQMRVAINLSAHQLRHPDLADRIDMALRRHDIKPQLLDLRDHRVGGDGRRVERDPHGRAAQPARRQHLDRRLRHRLLEPVVPEKAARRRAEDRQELRPRPRDQRRRARRRRRHRQAGARDRPEGRRRGRRDRGAAPDPALVRLPRAAGLPVRAADVAAGALGVGDGRRRPARARVPRLALPRDGGRRRCTSRVGVRPCGRARFGRLPTIGA